MTSAVGLVSLLVLSGCDPGPDPAENLRIPLPQARPAGTIPSPEPSPDPTPTPAPSSFDLRLFPASLNALPGESASTELHVFWEGEPTAPVELRVEGLPAGFTAMVDAERLTVHASEDATVDGHAIATVVATDGARTDAAPFAIFSQPYSGALDTSFGEDGVVEILTRVVEVFEMDDGDLMVYGRGESDNAPTLCRLTSNGTVDTSFGEDGCVAYRGFSYAHASNRLLRVRDGFVIAGNQMVWRVHEDGTVDSDFGDGGIVRVDPSPRNDWIRGAAVDGDGNVVVVGETYLPEGESDGFVVRLRADGSLDWTLLLDGTPRTASTLEDGRIVVLAGWVRAFLPDGTPDASFGDGGVQKAARGSLMTVHAGEIYVGDDGVDFGVTRLDSTGAVLWSRYDGYTRFEGDSLRVGPDGSIVFGGTQGGSGLGIARRTPDGFIDAGFAPGGIGVFRDSNYDSGALPLRDGGFLVYGEAPDFGEGPYGPGLLIRVDG